MARLRVVVATVIVSVAVVVGACGSSTHVTTRRVAGGSADVGERLIGRYGCGRCHEIPGIKGANGLVGPPLIKFGRRAIIAGELANTPDNLIRWIRDPKRVEPKTDMPDLRVTTQEARNIAAYLLRLG